MISGIHICSAGNSKLSMLLCAAASQVNAESSHFWKKTLVNAYDGLLVETIVRITQQKMCLCLHEYYYRMVNRLQVLNNIEKASRGIFSSK